jgi:hypothetical protein
MNRLVCHQISKNAVWRHNQTPVQRQVSLGGTVTPFCSLAHDVNASGLLLQTRADDPQMVLDLSPRLPTQPIFQAARRWHPRSGAFLHYDLATSQTNAISPQIGSHLFYANLRSLTPKKNFGLVFLWHADLPQPFDTPKLGEDPRAVAREERSHIVVGSIGGLQDLDAVGPHPNAQLQRRPRHNEPVVDPPPAKFDLIVPA